LVNLDRQIIVVSEEIKMKSPLPENAVPILDWSWEKVEPHFEDLVFHSLDEKNISGWLADWSKISKLMDELYCRLYDATTKDTSDQEAERRYANYLDHIRPQVKASEQKLKNKLLSSGITPAGYEVPLRDLRAQAELFRDENLPLLSADKKLAIEYDKIVGAQTVIFDGKEITLPQLEPVYLEADRERREQAWRLASERQLADREAINDLWEKMMAVRVQIAENTDLPNFRAYRWRELLRFDYTPQDCFNFHRAIKDVIVPAAQSIYKKRRQRLGVTELRPWDLYVDPFGQTPLKPFSSIDELEIKTNQIFAKVDPKFGEYFGIMREEGLLDLENRMNKAPGGYCNHYSAAERPYIFMNAVGVHDDVQTLLHEGGHAIHIFELGDLPFFFLDVSSEFAEVASMSMELLAAPFLTADLGGFYSPQEAARARIQFLESNLLFWPYMAVVDAFQHWVYENQETAKDASQCDGQWVQLWEEYMPGVDWSGFEDALVTGWHRKLHIFDEPFYYIEYGLAQMAAIQIWRNSLSDHTGAVADYRRALSLGTKVTLPQLYATAGARFSFDQETLTRAADLSLKTISQLEELIM
jgi:oligoendopeptidase F